MRGRERHRRERDPEARPERLPLGGPARELGEVGERPVRRAEGLGERQEERIADEPEEQKRPDERAATPPRRALTALSGRRAGRGPPGDGATRTRSPSRAASGGGEHLDLAGRGRRDAVVGRRGRRSAARATAPVERVAARRARESQRLGTHDEVDRRAARRAAAPATAGQTGPPRAGAAPSSQTHRQDARAADERRDEPRGRLLVELLRRADLLEPPAFRTATRSPSSKASSCSCVTKSVVMPTRRIARLSSRRVRSRSVGSRFDSGSSSSRTRGLRRERARERDALLLAARDLRHAAVLEPREARQRERLGDARPGVGARGSRCAVEAEGDVLADGQVRERARSAGRPCRTGGARAAVPVTSSPSTRIRPESGVSNPATSRSTVVLPLPDGPSRATISPFAAESETPRVTASVAEALLERLEPQEVGHRLAHYSTETSQRRRGDEDRTKRSAPKRQEERLPEGSRAALLPARRAGRR